VLARAHPATATPRSSPWTSAARRSGRRRGFRRHDPRAARADPGRAGRGAIVRACIDLAVEVRRRHQAGPPRCPSRPSASPLPAAGSPAGGSSIPRTSAAAPRHALAGLVGEALGLPAFLDRDTQVAALAAGRFGAAAGCADFLYLTIPPSGGRRADGRLLRGPRDGRELGHLVVDRVGHRVPAGCPATRGDRLGSGIARAARGAAARGESVPLAELIAARGEWFGARDVAAAERPATGPRRRSWPTPGTPSPSPASPSSRLQPGPHRRGRGRRGGPGRASPGSGPSAIADGAFRRPASRVRIVPAALGDESGCRGRGPRRGAAGPDLLRVSESGPGRGLGKSTGRRGRPDRPGDRPQVTQQRRA